MVQQDGNSANVPARDSSLGEFRQMVAELTRQNQQLMSSMMAQRNIPTAPPPDPMAAVTGLIGALAPILAAAVGRPVPADAGGGGVSAMRDLLGVVTMVKELGIGGAPASRGDDDDGDGGTMGVLKAGIQALPSLVQAINSRPQVIQVPASASGQPMLPRPPTPQNIQQPNPAANIPQPVQLTPEQNAMIAELIKQINQMSDILDGNAASNSPQPDAAALAELFADQIPDEQIDKIGGLLERPDLFAYMSKLAPRIANHAEWWQAFFAGLATQFTTDEPATPLGNFTP
jgi:hypothetical protein